jgi:hypothetical protein
MRECLGLGGQTTARRHHTAGALRCLKEPALLVNFEMGGALLLPVEASKVVAKPLLLVTGVPVGFELIVPEVAAPEDPADQAS